MTRENSVLNTFEFIIWYKLKKMKEKKKYISWKPFIYIYIYTHIYIKKKEPLLRCFTYSVNNLLSPKWVSGEASKVYDWKTELCISKNRAILDWIIRYWIVENTRNLRASFDSSFCPFWNGPKSIWAKLIFICILSPFSKAAILHSEVFLGCPIFKHVLTHSFSCLPAAQHPKRLAWTPKRRPYPLKISVVCPCSDLIPRRNFTLPPMLWWYDHGGRLKYGFTSGVHWSQLPYPVEVITGVLTHFPVLNGLHPLH